MRISQLKADQKPAKLDATDYAIIGRLMAEPRRPLNSIAKELELVEATVRNRVKKLVSKGVIEFALVTNPLQFGFQVWAMLHIEVEPAEIRQIAHRLAQLPEVHIVGIVAGVADIFAGVALRSNQELIDLISDQLPKINGIVRITTSTLLEVVKRLVSFGFPPEVLEEARKATASRDKAFEAK